MGTGIVTQITRNASGLGSHTENGLGWFNRAFTGGPVDPGPGEPVFPGDYQGAAIISWTYENAPVEQRSTYAPVPAWPNNPSPMVEFVERSLPWTFRSGFHKYASGGYDFNIKTVDLYQQTSFIQFSLGSAVQPGQTVEFVQTGITVRHYALWGGYQQQMFHQLPVDLMVYRERPDSPTDTGTVVAQLELVPTVDQYGNPCLADREFGTNARETNISDAVVGLSNFWIGWKTWGAIEPTFQEMTDFVDTAGNQGVTLQVQLEVKFISWGPLIRVS